MGTARRIRSNVSVYWPLLTTSSATRLAQRPELSQHHLLGPARSDEQLQYAQPFGAVEQRQPDPVAAGALDGLCVAIGASGDRAVHRQRSP